MVYGGGKFWNKWQRGPKERFVDDIPPPMIGSQMSLEKSLVKCQSDAFFLPWKNALDTSLECHYWMQYLFSMRENDYFIQIEPREWDACIFINNVSPAIPIK